MKATSLAVFAFVSLALAPDAYAQDQDWGVWSAFAGQGHLRRQDPKARWRWWFDAHARFFEDSDGFEQSIVRPGLGYDLTPDSTLWLGYAWIYTDPAGNAGFDEHRIWQQYTWAPSVGETKLYFRSRLEQRFVETGDDLGWRFRQFVRGTRQFEQGSRHGFRLWDEVFIDLNDTDWGADTGFAQNRLFAGLGWTFDEEKHFTLEYGYLNQYIRRDGAEDSMNHILGLTLLLTL